MRKALHLENVKANLKFLDRYNTCSLLHTFCDNNVIIATTLVQVLNVFMYNMSDFTRQNVKSVV